MQFNKIGKIIKGRDFGWYILIQPDVNKFTGEQCYWLFLCDKPDFKACGEGYDYWLENYRNLLAQMEFFEWEIEWLDETWYTSLHG